MVLGSPGEMGNQKGAWGRKGMVVVGVVCVLGIWGERTVGTVPLEDLMGHICLEIP